MFESPKEKDIKKQTNNRTALSDSEKLLAEEMIQNFKMGLFYVNSFFYALSSFVQWIPCGPDVCATAMTDGNKIWFNYRWYETLSFPERNGVFAHEILHCALMHCLRRGERKPRLWNLAGDIMINNGYMRDFSWCRLPKCGVDKPEYLTDSIEETYNLLLENEDKLEELLDSLELDLTDYADPAEGEADSMTSKELEANWNNALKTALRDHKQQKKGSIPEGLQRLVEEIDDYRVPWQQVLRDYVVRFPCDFVGFDRRFIARGLYIDDFAGEALDVYVCIDTSGSIGNSELSLFLGELKAITSCYPHVKVHFYWADAALYGPYELEGIEDMPALEGGGGTSFKPFFKAVAKAENTTSNGLKLAIYFTDGYGDFPREAPDFDTLWVTLPDSLSEEDYPFGQVTSLAD